ncbi:MAG: peptidylprolyl isomerase [bacterium]
MLSFFRKKMKTIMMVVVVIFAASMFYGISATRFSGGTDRPSGIAKVNGQQIDPLRYREIVSRVIGQFGDDVRPQDLAFIQNLAIGQTIDFTLVLNQAKRKVKVSGYEIDMAIENIMKQGNFSSQQQLEGVLKQSGLTLSKFKSMMKNEMLVQKMVNTIRQEAQVTPDDLREVKASHILVSTEALANELVGRLAKGDDFAALAKEYSKDLGSGKQGGDLGYFTTGRMVKPFEQAVFALKVDEVSKPVKSDFGYHIIKLTDSRLRTPTGEEKDIEKQVLAEKQGQAFQKWFSGIKSKAKVELLSPELKAHEFRFRGQVREAIEKYNEAIALTPANAFLYIFLGDTYNTIGQKKMALEQYQKAVAIDGGNAELYILLADAYKNNDQKKEAIEQYKKASMVAADDKKLHEKLGTLFKDLNAWTEYRDEQAEIKRIEKKEAFEKELSREE